MFDDKFLESLPDNPTEGALIICEGVMDFYKKNGSGIHLHDNYLEAMALLETYYKLNNINLKTPKITSNEKKTIDNFIAYVDDNIGVLKHLINDKSYDNLKNKFEVQLKGGFCYEFTDGDLKRIQVIINELREQITDFSDFEDKHRQRLLKRLEKLQSEMHKKVSDIDRIWGLVGDAGVILGKFGKDVKPLVDRIKELAKIGWRTQANAEELPSDAPFPGIGNDTHQD